MSNSVFDWLLTALLSISLLADTSGDSWWPQFRGPNAIGVAEPGEYAVELNTDKNLVWKTDLPSGISSPCIWGDRIFLTAFDQSQNILETICVLRENGKILWRKPAPAKSIEKVHDISSPANATPATDGQRVYVYFESYGLQAFDFDGEEVWSRELPLLQSSFGSGTSPIVVSGKVVLIRDHRAARNRRASSKGKIVAFDAETGDEVWSTKRPSSRVKYATPVIWQNGGNSQILVVGSNRLTSYDLDTGEEVWFVDDLPPQACATPLLHGSRAYVTATGMFGEPDSFVDPPKYADLLTKHDSNQDLSLSEDEIPDDLLVIDRRASKGAGNSPLKQFFKGIDRNRDKKIDEKEWDRFKERFGRSIRNSQPGVFALSLGGSGDVTKKNTIWKNSRGVAEVPSLLLHSDKLFLVRNGGIVHCRDVSTGKDIYRGRLGSIGGYYASPVAANGKVYFASDRGVVTVIDATSADLQVLAKNDLGESIMATPALVDGIVYIRTESCLYAFGKR